MKGSLKQQVVRLLAVFLFFGGSLNVFAVPEIQSWQTVNGGKVLFIETHVLPMVDFKLVFAGGSARDGEIPGLAFFTNALLNSGAGRWSADEIAEQLEGIGAKLETDSARDMALVTLRSLNEPDKLTTALEILEAVIGKPQFNLNDIERDRQRILAMLQHKQQQPASVADEAFNRLLYGSHPYANPSEGTTESIARITRDDLLAFHQRYYVARNTVLAIVGDITRDRAEAIAEQILGSLPAGDAAPPIPKVETVKKAQLQRIPMPITQTHIIIGQPLIARGDADFFPLYVGNHILGGSGFGSRLMNEIREQRGLAYDTHSYFVPMAAAGPFRAAVQTRNDQAEEAQRLLQETVSRFVAEGPTDDEMHKAIRNISGNFPLNIDSNSDLIGYLGMIGFYNHPLDHLQTFVSRIQAVTAAQVLDAFKRRLHPENFTTVIVGGAAEDK